MGRGKYPPFLVILVSFSQYDDSVGLSQFLLWFQIILEAPLAVLFERSDANRDNVLTHNEFSKFFSSFDTNGNAGPSEIVLGKMKLI